MINDLIIPSEFGKNVEWITGIVRDRADPQNRGRVRVQWFGYYSDEIEVQDMPWCIPIQPITSGGIGGIGAAPVGLMEGTMVLGTWLDGKSQQNAAVLGVIGPIEGIVAAGANPNATINSNGVLDSGVVGPNTPSNAKFTGSGPRWFQAAQGELGQREVVGSGHNPRVLQYAVENGFSDDETPWCSSFAKWCARQAGQNVSGVNGLARSWLRAPGWEPISNPLYGCIVVYNRPPNPSSGHVGFVNEIRGGRVMTLGGNQSNAVNIQGYSTSRVLGYRWTRGEPQEPFRFR